MKMRFLTRPEVGLVVLMLLGSGIAGPNAHAESLSCETSTEFLLTGSITQPWDTSGTLHRKSSHDDRIPAQLSSEVVARRRAQAFDAQRWAVGAPVGLLGTCALVAATGGSAATTTASVLGATGLVVGPAFGWIRAGYWDRAAISMTMRAGTILGTLVLTGVAASGIGGETDLGVVLVGLGVGGAVVVAESFYDVRHLGRHVRAHGFAHDAQFSLLTTHGPGLALTLPLP